VEKEEPKGEKTETVNEELYQSKTEYMMMTESDGEQGQ